MLEGGLKLSIVVALVLSVIGCSIPKTYKLHDGKLPSSQISVLKLEDDLAVHKIDDREGDLYPRLLGYCYYPYSYKFRSRIELSPGFHTAIVSYLYFLAGSSRLSYSPEPFSLGFSVKPGCTYKMRSVIFKDTSGRLKWRPEVIEVQ